MAAGIKHESVATGADDPDKEINKGEWNANHVFEESGGATLTVGSIADGQFLKRSGTTLTSAAGTSTSTPTFPGGIALTGVSYPLVYGSNLSTGTNDLLLSGGAAAIVPTGKRWLICGYVIYNNSGVGNIVWSPQIKISASYYRLATNTTTGNGATGTSGNTAYIAEAGETVAITTATNNGANVWVKIIQFDSTAAVKSAKLTSLALGDNTVYTCPASTTAFLLDPSFVLPGVQNVSFKYWNNSGGSRVITWHVVPSGSAVGTGFKITPATTVTADAVSGLVGITPSLSAGDFININTDANTATQMAWVNVMEIT